MPRADSLEKILMLGKSEGKRRRGWQRLTWLDSTTDSRDMNLSKLWEIVEGQRSLDLLQSIGLQKVGHHFAIEKQIGL